MCLQSCAGYIMAARVREPACVSSMIKKPEGAAVVTSYEVTWRPGSTSSPGLQSLSHKIMNLISFIDGHSRVKVPATEQHAVVHWLTRKHLMLNGLLFHFHEFDKVHMST